MSLLFDEATHTYTVDGEDLPSVTEVCRFLAYDYKSAQPWLAQEAARRGTLVHQACALIDYGEEPEETPEIAGDLTAYRRFLHDYRPEWELIEHPMGSTALGFAGTLDRFGTFRNGSTVLLDIKTGQLHKAALEAQLTGYDTLLQIAYFADPRPLEGIERYALQLNRDGTYKLAEVSRNSDLFNACMTLHNATKKKGRTT